MNNRSSKLAFVLVLLHIVSISLGPLVNHSYTIDDIPSFLWIVVICIHLFLIITPWKKVGNQIQIKNEKSKGVAYLLQFLLSMSMIGFVVFVPVIFIVNSLEIDINDFKYNGGLEDFVNSGLFPVPRGLFILANFIGDFSIFAIPVHFYYLYHNNKKMTWISFVLSLTFVMKGVVYFSRVLPALYVLLYISFYLLMNNNLKRNAKRFVRRIILLGGLILFVQFVQISISRFSSGLEMENLNKKFSGDRFQYISDPTIVSYIDYASQGYYYDCKLLEDYNGKTFNGKITFQHLFELLNQYLGFPYSSEKALDEKKKIWGDHWFTFNGYVAYVVYDFGIVLSFMISLAYYIIVGRICKHIKKRGCITFHDMCIMTLLIIIPLTSIFFSSYSMLVLPFIFYYITRFICYKLAKII